MPDNARIDAASSGPFIEKGQEAAHPVTFSGIPGLFTPASASTPARNLAVLFLSPWGIDELSTRRFFRVIAEELAKIGIASLRFDYPGTGNALDAPDASIEADDWSRAAIAGSTALRRFSGADNVVLLGFGLGGAIALKASREIENLAGMALLAPVLAGRRYLRELAVWSSMIDAGVGVPAHRRDTAPGTIAGLTMPSGVVATLETLNAKSLPDIPASRIFLAWRPENTSDRQLLDQLTARGVDIRGFEFSGYDRLVENPHGQRFPQGLIPGILEWIAEFPQADMLAQRTPQDIPPAAMLVSGNIRETAIRFGDGLRLAGTLCEAVENATGVTVVMVSTAYDYQAGWGRSSVELARRLASQGIASLRFDSAGVGDSPPVPGRRMQVLYDDPQISDVAIARDYLREIGRNGPALVYGRCSGAYVAFRAAAEDDRWAGCIVVNPFIYRWRGTPPEDIGTSAPRPLADYSQKAFRWETVRRVFKGDVNIGAALRHIALRLGQRFSNLLAPVLGPLMPNERLNRAVHADIRALSRRPGTTSIVYSEGDVGLDNLHVHFGDNGEKLTTYPNVTLTILAETDHNVTPKASREELFGIVERAASALARGNAGIRRK